jgi:hypothetical protein
MRVREFPLRELNKRALRAVARELGPAGFVRFLQQYEGGTGDYTRDRHKILSHVTGEQLEADLRKVRQEILKDPVLRAKMVIPAARSRSDYTKERRAWLGKDSSKEFAQAARGLQGRKRLSRHLKKDNP